MQHAARNGNGKDEAISDEGDTTSESGPTVVGIGASAGNLSALKRFFSLIPSDSGLAFVVVVHLSPKHESHLDELLQHHASFPVRQVTETVPLEPNHVYIIPPNANLDAVDTHLRCSRLEAKQRPRAPVDHFFRTLSETHDGGAIGIILTGTGSDGALGIKQIKERGGLAIVQSPGEAEYDEMPQSAIATGVVDLVLPLDEIPSAVLRFAQTKPRLELGAALADDTRALLQKVVQLRARTNPDFSRCKHSTLMRRIARRMQLHQTEALADYLDLLRQNADEVRALADDLLITVTTFFRDPQVMKRLEEEIVPQILSGKRADDEVRAWSVGCATGEEAYSLAILLLEAAGRLESPPRIQVFASDLHEPSLERARQGFFPGDIESDVSTERLRRFFVKEDGAYRIRKEVRETVIFASQNPLSDPPFSRLDLVNCRNLLIYLQRGSQNEVMALFHYALRPDGILVVGTSETIGASELFVAQGKKSCIYRRRDLPTPEPRLPLFQTWRGGPIHQPTSDDRPPPPYGAIHERIVERYAPPSMLVSPIDTVVHLSEHAGRYLVHPGGELTASVFKLLREELRLELRGAFSQARRAEGVRTSPVPVRLNGETRAVTLRVQTCLEETYSGFILVMFDEHEMQASHDRRRRPTSPQARNRAHTRGETSSRRSWRFFVSACRRSSRSTRRARRKCAPRTKSSSPPTKSCAPRWRSSKRARKSSTA